MNICNITNLIFKYLFLLYISILKEELWKLSESCEFKLEKPTVHLLG